MINLCHQINAKQAELQRAQQHNIENNRAVFFCFALAAGAFVADFYGKIIDRKFQKKKNNNKIKLKLEAFP